MRFDELLYESYEIVVEGAVDDVLPDLESMGFTEFKRKSGVTVHILVPASQRKEAMAALQSLPGAEYDKNLGGSLGTIIYKGAKIEVKPVGKQGAESAGLKNEQHLIDTINRFVEERGPIDITFIGANNESITVQDVTAAQGVGADTKNRKKSDVNLVSGKKRVPLSIKKHNAEFWESADTIFGNEANEIVKKLAESGDITLTPLDKYRRDGAQFVKISPEVAIETTPEETLDLVFGSDVLAGNGAVIKETFEDEHYAIDDNNNLTVTVDMVIKQPDDIPEHMIVWWHIRNDSSRSRGDKEFPGLRIIAAYASRVKNALKLDRKGNKL